MRAPKRIALGLQGSKDVRLHSTVSGDTNEIRSFKLLHLQRLPMKATTGSCAMDMGKLTGSSILRLFKNAHLDQQKSTQFSNMSLFESKVADADHDKTLCTLTSHQACCRGHVLMLVSLLAISVLPSEVENR